jgi:hypothetical protein
MVIQLPCAAARTPSSCCWAPNGHGHARRPKRSRLAARPGAPALIQQLATGPIELVLLVTIHRRESWGPRTREVAQAVARLARAHPDLIVVLPLHPNPTVRDALLPALRGLRNVLVVEPMSYGPGE